MIRIVFNSGEITARLYAASRGIDDMTGVHQEIGEYIVEATRARFRTSTAPDGSKWQKKSPATIARYLARGDGRKTKPLIGPSGRLSKEIVLTANRKEVEVGSALEYSGVMQDGAQVGAFGADKAGHPIPWGTIPARVWLGLSDTDERNIIDIVDGALGAPFGE